MEYRCPKHDCVFQTLTDQRPPDSPARGNFPRHPIHGHPDCSQCQDDQVAAITHVPVSHAEVPVRISNRA